MDEHRRSSDFQYCRKRQVRGEDDRYSICSFRIGAVLSYRCIWLLIIYSKTCLKSESWLRRSLKCHFHLRPVLLYIIFSLRATRKYCAIYTTPVRDMPCQWICMQEKQAQHSEHNTQPTTATAQDATHMLWYDIVAVRMTSDTREQALTIIVNIGSPRQRQRVDANANRKTGGQ